ncbi:MAG: T9SS type A sorting domain-containing protein [Aurantibacter sp.]
MKRILFLSLFAFSLSFSAQAQVEPGETSVAKKVKVFPNPAANVVNVLGLQNSGRAEIIVSDSYGNIVLKHHWAIKNKALNIPITSLGSGIYVITIRSEEQQVQTKFYKQ